MTRIGDDDQFESEYMAMLRALLTPHGVPVSYEKDRVGIDTGLHLFVEGPSGFDATHARVWFQAKGKRTSTLPLDRYQELQDINVVVQVSHLQFWFASPEPVYLVVYVQSADVFVAEDVRDIVERQWPAGSFYPAVRQSGKTVTLRVDTSQVLDSVRLKAMLAHRSMRIDGPAFRGRPLGHRFDPLRSQIEVCSPDLFERLIGRVFDAHDFRERDSAAVSLDLRLASGVLHQTLAWQSPAFAEFGFGPPVDFREEPAVEFIHGSVLIAVDMRPEREDLADKELAALRTTLDDSPEDVAVAIVFNASDLSSTGGLWRSTLRDLQAFDRSGGVTLIGLEAVTSLLLVATLIYLDVAPELSWRYVNYQY